MPVRDEIAVYQERVLFETDAWVAVRFSCIRQSLSLPNDAVTIFWIDYVVRWNVYGEANPIFVADCE
jgi:hypothetical protein